MRVGNFSLLVQPGTERDSGHVELPHGTVYTLRLGNHSHRRCDAEVEVDGKVVGAWRLNPWDHFYLERPAHDTGRFTFFEASTPEAEAAGAGKIDRDHRGLIRVTFRPEWPPRTAGVLRSAGLAPGEEYTSGSIGGASAGPMGFGENLCRTSGAKGMSAGVTGLTGQSGQNFMSVGPLDYDRQGTVIISLRLVVGSSVPDIRELTPARGNPVPNPVE